MYLHPLVAYEDDPPGVEVHHPYGAFNQGWDAYEAGYALRLCPYPETCRWRAAWRQGWVEAWAEANGVWLPARTLDFATALAA